MPGALLLTGSTFDEDCGQGTEDERLDAAAEPVEIQAGKGRDADLEQLDLTQEARQPAKDDVAQACQCTLGVADSRCQSTPAVSQAHWADVREKVVSFEVGQMKRPRCSRR